MAKKPVKKKRGSSKKRSATPKPFKLSNDWPYLAIIFGVGVLFLWPVIQADFTEMDDKKLIIQNMTYNFFKAPSAIWTYSIFSPHYKPLAVWTWYVEAKLFGFSAPVMHFTNLVLHLFNAVLSFLLALKVSGSFKVTREHSRLIALATGVFFALHPMHVESVAWAMGRKDLLYTLFFLSGMLMYLRFLESKQAKWMGLVCLFFVCSLLSKSPAVMFPFMLFLLDFAKGIPFNGKSILQKIPVFVLLILGLTLYGVFGGEMSTAVNPTEGRLLNLAASKPVSSLEPLDSWPAFYAKYALVGFKGVFWYLHSLFPIKLALAYPYKIWIPQMGNALHVFPLILIAAGLGIFWKRNTYRFLFFTHAWFFMALTPAIVRTGLGKGIFVSDRYAYLALFGFLLFIAGGLVYTLAKRNWSGKNISIALGTIGVIYGIMAFAQARLWDNGETLWTNNIEHYPQVAYAYSNRGLYYDETGQPAKAQQDFSKAADLEDDVHALLRRSTMLRQQGKYDEALADINRLLARNPADSYALNAKGNVFFAQKKYQEALEVYNTGLALMPSDVSLLANRGTTFYYLRQVDNALADFKRVESIQPSYSGLYQKMTVVYNAKGDLQNVVKYARLEAQANPSNHANFGDLGRALQQLGRHQEAIDAYTRAIELMPNGKRYYTGRASSYRAIGNAAAAQADQTKADSL